MGRIRRSVSSLWGCCVAAWLGTGVWSWPPAESSVLAQSIDTSRTKTPDSLRSFIPRVMVSLDVESGGSCKPDFSVAGVGVSAFVFPAYTERFGLAFTGHATLTLPRGIQSGLTPSYNEREDRVYFTQSVYTPLGKAFGASLKFREWASTRDGERRLGIELRARSAGGCEKRLELGVTRGQYVPLRGRAAGEWTPGEFFELSLGASFNGWAHSAPLVKTLMISAEGAYAPSVLGGVLEYQKFVATAAARNNYLLAWTRVGWIGGSPPSQVLFESAGDAMLSSRPTWQDRGSSIWAAGVEADVKLLDALRPVLFARAASLPDLDFRSIESGIGFGLKDPDPESPPIWVLRVDWPVYSTMPEERRERWDIRRFTVRLWLLSFLSQSPLGSLGVPDMDYRYP